MEKSAYFLPENIDRESERMMRALGARRAGGKLCVGKRKTALIVIDMQEYFTSERSHAYVPSSRAVIPRIKKTMEAFSMRGFPVFMTRHLNNGKNAGAMQRWWKDIIREKDPLSRISPALDGRRGVKIRKSQYDAFYGTSLDSMLKKAGTERVLICGVLTNLCCETTARSAFVRGYDVMFAVDGTATYRRDFHFSSLLNLSHGFAVPVTTGGVIKSLG